MLKFDFIVRRVGVGGVSQFLQNQWQNVGIIAHAACN